MDINNILTNLTTTATNAASETFFSKYKTLIFILVIGAAAVTINLILKLWKK